MSALARTTRKSIVNRSERASRPSRATDRLRKSLWDPLGHSWAALRLKRGSWALLDALGALLGRSWALLGRSWGAAGDLGSISAFAGNDFGLSGRRFWGFRTSVFLPPRSHSESDLGLTCKRLASGLRTNRRGDCERLASDSRLRRAHCAVDTAASRPKSTRVAGRLPDTRCEAKARRVYQSRRHTDRHTHVAKQKLDDLTARLSGRSCKRSRQLHPILV